MKHVSSHAKLVFPFIFGFGIAANDAFSRNLIVEAISRVSFTVAHGL